jgi:hypothetical protein
MYKIFLYALIIFSFLNNFCGEEPSSIAYNNETVVIVFNNAVADLDLVDLNEDLLQMIEDLLIQNNGGNQPPLMPLEADDQEFND